VQFIVYDWLDRKSICNSWHQAVKLYEVRVIKGYVCTFVIDEQVLGCLNGTQVRSELRLPCGLAYGSV